MYTPEGNPKAVFFFLALNESAVSHNSQNADII